MDKRRTKKPTVWMRKKLVVLYLLILAAFVGLGFRMYTIVRDRGADYKKQVLQQQSYDSRTLPARRGSITDSLGTVLAVSEKVYTVILDTYHILEKEEYLEPSVAAIVDKFGIDEGELRTYISEHPSSRYHILKRRLPYEQISAYSDLIDPSSPNYDSNIQGIWFEESYQRNYPAGSLASDIIGFTTSDGQGLYGLEEYYDEALKGTAGREYGYLDDDLNLERTIIDPDDGDSLELTIDSNVQMTVKKYIREFMDAHRNEYRFGDGANNVGCVIMRVKTGEILAMADSGSYDPNNTRDRSLLPGRVEVDHVGNPVKDANNDFVYLTDERLDEMDDELLMQQFNSLWRNFTISDTYEPGSVIKPFTVATGIESGKMTGNEHFTCNRYLTVGDYDIGCHTLTGHGDVDARRGVEVSCNVYMMRSAAMIGAETFAKYQNQFGFGLRTGVDLAGEARTQNLVFKAEDLGSTELATASFGQGFNVTMIETISAFASLINGGYLYEPHLVKRVVSGGGATVRSIEPRVLKQTVSRTTSDTIRSYCNTVVSGENGTGKTARPAGYMIGGKTGTAETLPRGNKKWYVVSFMGYAPADDPEIAIYVVVDRPNTQYQDDAKYATGIVRNILTEILPYLGIPMTEALSDAERAELEARESMLEPVYGPSTSSGTGEGEESAGASTSSATGDGETVPEPVEGIGEGEENAGASTSSATGEPDPEPVEGPDLSTFEKDSSGYLVDPESGAMIDPDTGNAIGIDILPIGSGTMPGVDENGNVISEDSEGITP